MSSGAGPSWPPAWSAALPPHRPGRPAGPGAQTLPAAAPPPRREYGREQAHHRRALHPGNLLPVACAVRLSGTKKMLRPMSSPNTGSISARLTSVKAVASMLPARQCGSGSRGRDRSSQPARPLKTTRTSRAPSPRKTRPTVLPDATTDRPALQTDPRCASCQKESSSSGSRISSGMPGSARPLGAHLLHAPEAGFAGRFILKNQRPGLSSTLVSHA
jgi:hypothetical protein